MVLTELRRLALWNEIHLRDCCLSRLMTSQVRRSMGSSDWLMAAESELRMDGLVLIRKGSVGFFRMFWSAVQAAADDRFWIWFWTL